MQVKREVRQGQSDEFLTGAQARSHKFRYHRWAALANLYQIPKSNYLESLSPDFASLTFCDNRYIVRRSLHRRFKIEDDLPGIRVRDPKPAVNVTDLTSPDFGMRKMVEGTVCDRDYSREGLPWV
jgi:hypothetical protein